MLVGKSPDPAHIVYIVKKKRKKEKERKERNYSLQYLFTGCMRLSMFYPGGDEVDGGGGGGIGALDIVWED